MGFEPRTTVVLVMYIGHRVSAASVIYTGLYLLTVKHGPTFPFLTEELEYCQSHSIKNLQSFHEIDIHDTNLGHEILNVWVNRPGASYRVLNLERGSKPGTSFRVLNLEPGSKPGASFRVLNLEQGSRHGM